MLNFVPFLLAVSLWSHFFFRESCFCRQGGAGRVLKGEAHVIKVIAKVVVALRVLDVVAIINAASILACEVAHVTDAADVRRHFEFARGTKSGKDGWSLSSSFQTRLFNSRIRALKEVFIAHLSGRGNVSFFSHEEM